ncbi:MAG: hypothetical protein GWN58_45345, partial [Anaerolineae bacterium]|nr:hypothetical protein [Anaerolineae bacterium]
MLIKTGLMKLLDDPELLENQEKRQAWIEKMGEKQQARLAEGEYQLFNYCAGWGVKDNPPEEAMDELAALGFAERGMPHLTRANWLRFLFLDGDDEAGTLVGAVMSLTAKGD